MPRSFGLLLLAPLLCCPVACRRARRAASPDAAAVSPQFAATVHMGDPRSAGQLLAGFYGIEAGAWRWTGKQFAVELGVPYGAAAKGAALELNLTIPPVVIERSKSVTLGASLNGAPLPPETYTAPGAYTYRRQLPPGLLSHDSVKVNFNLDKTFSPGGGDLRQLGIVATAVGLK